MRLDHKSVIAFTRLRAATLQHLEHGQGAEKSFPRGSGGTRIDEHDPAVQRNTLVAG